MTSGSTEATGTPQLAGMPGDGALDVPLLAGILAAGEVLEANEVLPAGDTVAGTRFAHASEAEMARILDFYAVRWEYEPTTFPILWNLDGAVIESFAPDFYLPELELFLEMTTLRQRLVRKKNRKLRRLRELYPDIRIKLFYARDFRAMMLKYGRLALAEALSGTPGQVVSERAQAAAQLARSALQDAEKALHASTAAASPDPAFDLPVGEPAASAAAPAVELETLRAPEPVSSGGTSALRPSPRARAGRRRRRVARAIAATTEQESGA